MFLLPYVSLRQREKSERGTVIAITERSRVKALDSEQLTSCDRAQALRKLHELHILGNSKIEVRSND